MHFSLHHTTMPRWDPVGLGPSPALSVLAVQLLEMNGDQKDGECG